MISVSLKTIKGQGARSGVVREACKDVKRYKSVVNGRSHRRLALALPLRLPLMTGTQLLY